MEGLEMEPAMIVIVAADQEISQNSNSLHQKYEFLSNSVEARANSDLKCLWMHNGHLCLLSPEHGFADGGTFMASTALSSTHQQ